MLLLPLGWTVSLFIVHLYIFSHNSNYHALFSRQQWSRDAPAPTLFATMEVPRFLSFKILLIYKVALLCFTVGAAASCCLFDRLIPPCASVLVVGLARTTSSRVQECEALYWLGKTTKQIQWFPFRYYSVSD